MDEVKEEIIMTPSKKGKATCIKIERKKKAENQADEHHHVAGGEHKGLVINKESQGADEDLGKPQVQLGFNCFLVDQKTGKHAVENRKLKFWYVEKADYLDQVTTGFNFFRELLKPENFPKDYVGFIKKCMKLMQKPEYNMARKIDLEIQQLDDAEAPRTPGLQKEDLRPIEEIVREKLLQILESAYPNVLSVEDLCRICDVEEAVVILQLKELQSRNLIREMEKGGFVRHVLDEKTEVQDVKQMATVTKHQQPTIAIITANYCEKLAVDAMMQDKTTFVKFKTNGMAKRKTHLTIKVSRPRKKELKRARQKEAQLIPRSCLKWPGFLDLIASPQISLKKKKQNSPIKLTDRKRTFLSRSPGTPLSKGTPHGRQKFRPTPSKSPAMKRLRGSSARSLFSNETCDDTFEAFPLVFTEQESADVGEFKVSSRSLINVDPLEPVHQMSDTLQSVSISQTPHEQEIQEMNAILPDVLKALEESGTKKSFLDFCRLVHSNNFPLDNIAYLLWVEVLRWYTTENTSSMRYSDQTKKFWKLGLRIFGGKFINFMSGHKNTAQVVLGEASKGEFSPLNSEINFAVPSVDILRSFTPYSEFETRERPPGMLTDAMQSLAGALKSKSACLTYDGKKIKQGLTENSGDVNILGHEDSMSLRQRQEELKSKICVIEKTVKDLEQLESCVDIKTLNQETHTNSVQSLQFALKDLSCSVIDILDIKEKKEYSKKKLIERGGEENWRKGKYVFAISGIIAFIHDIDDFLQGFEKLRETICQYLAYIQGSKYITGNKVNINQCDNYQELGDSAPSTSDTRLVRQRTDEWKTIREKAKITGSTFFKAIGLDGLQKEKEHFEEVICHVPPKPFSEAVQEMLDYGTNNEQNAAATLVGKVLPVIEPNVRFYEEGCVELDESFMVVSPDGSLRQTDSLDSTTAAIEFKCPVYQLHKKLPPRYLLQCLAEMEALNVEKLIYLSWRPDFSSVFLLNKDSDLFERSYEIAKNIYGNENPKKPTKLSNDVKALKEEIATKSSNVELIGLFESAVNDRSVDNTNMSEAESVNAKDLLTVLNDIKTMQIRSYNLRREKASEAIVYLCCDLDRLWTKDSIKCAPVCWFPKGYSLNTETLRRVSQDVHNRCHEAGIHIPAESFDGQWHNLVVRSVMGQPLTVLQLQKDVWREAERTKKSDIIRTFKDLNKVPEYERECGKMICTNKGIILPGFPSVRNHHSTVQTDCIESNDMSTTLLETIPDSILHLNSDGALELQTELLAFTEVDKDIEIDIMSANVNDTEWANVLSNSENPEEESTDTSTTVISGPSVEVEPQNTEPDSDMNVMTGEHKLNVADAITLLALLKADNKCNKKGRWNDVQTGELMDILSSTDKLGKLRDFELRVLARYITRTSGIKVKESSSKASKLDSLSNILGLGKPQIDSRTKRRKATPRRLVELSSSVLSKKVSKHMLNIVYAKYIWQGRYKKWFNDSPLRENPVIDDSAYPSLWFYTPEFSETRQQLEVRCIDSTHLLTRARRKCCKGGLHGLPNTPWLTVAKTKTTFLSPIMIEEITEPMSVSMAVTHFSEPVERKMRQNGDIDAADLCRDIRDWWKSEDDPGIPAKDRIVMRQNLRERLLDEVDFNEFPPPTTNIRGWPLQLWEALLANIDAKSLLYALCETGTYNVRAFSSMMGETFFSELTQYDKQGHGTVTTTEFGRFIGTATEKLYTRMDPNRTFSYRTARSTVYKLVDHDSITSSHSDTDEQLQHSESKLANGERIIRCIKTKDHFFDQRDRKRLKGKKKEAVMSFERNAVERGTLGVRYEKARRNESKLLPTDRMGLSVDDEGFVRT